MGRNTANKTGLQPVSRPVEWFIVQKCVQKLIKKLTVPKLNKVRRIQRHHKTCFQTSGNRIGEIWPDFYIVWTLFPGFWGQGVHFWGQKSKNMRHEKNCQKNSGKKKKEEKMVNVLENFLIKC